MWDPVRYVGKESKLTVFLKHLRTEKKVYVSKGWCLHDNTKKVLTVPKHPEVSMKLSSNKCQL